MGQNHPPEPVSEYLDLKKAAEWKGVHYRTLINNPLKQPLLGYSRHIEGFGKKKKRYFPKEVVREWLGVFSEQFPAYVESLLHSEDPALLAYVSYRLQEAEKKGLLPESLRNFVLQKTEQGRRHV